MNRRNFILGLGTAATLSGAASVTGAAVQNAVAPSADFRVIAAQELNVIQNPFLDEGADANYTTVEPSNFDHNDTAATAGTNLTVNQGTDDTLSLALATGNDPDQPSNNFTGGNAPYLNNSPGGGTDPVTINSTDATSGSLDTKSAAEAPLAIENQTGSTRSVAIQYANQGGQLGAAVGNGVTQAEVETLFQFFIYDGTDYQQISPDGTGTDTPYSYVDVPAGSTKQVHLVLNLTQSISQSIQEAATATGGGFATNATDDVDLLDAAAFGTQN